MEQLTDELLHNITDSKSLRFPTTESQGIPQTLILLASSIAEL